MTTVGRGAAVRWLYLRRLRTQPLRTVLIVTAIAAGVGLTVGVLIARSSLENATVGFSRALAGPATLRVEGPVDHGGLDEAVTERVAQVPGVAQAVPLVIGVTRATDSGGQPTLIATLGIDCRAEAIVGSFDCTPEALQLAGEGVLLSPSLARMLGPQGTIGTSMGTRSVQGAPTNERLEAINDGRIAVYSLAASQRLFGRPGGIDTLLVVPQPGTNPTALERAVADAVGKHNQVMAADAPVGGSVFASTVLPFLLLISTLGLVIGSQLVSNSVTLSLEQRRRELALTGALGASPRAVIGGVLAESAAMGVAGGLLGLLVGIGIAGPFVASISDQVARVSGLHLSVRVPWPLIVVAVLIGVASAVLAALGPARRAASRDVAAELAGRAALETTVRRFPVAAIVLGTLLFGGAALSWLGQRGGSLEKWQPLAGTLGVVILSLGGFRLPVPFAAPLIARLGRLRWFRTGPASVAVANLVNDRKRTGSTTAAVAATVAIATALGGLIPALGHAARGISDAATANRVYVSTLIPNNSDNIDDKLSPTQIDALARLPGVVGIERVQAASIEHPDVGYIQLASGNGQPATYPLIKGVDQATALKTGGVMIGPGLARDKSLRPGDDITIPGRAGPVTLTVAGIWAAPDGVGRSITMSEAQMFTITGPQPPNWVLLTPVPGLSTATLAEQVRQSPVGKGLIVYDPEQQGEEYAREFVSFLSPFWALQRGLLVTAFVATLSTLLLAALQRRREHGLLGAIGMPPSDLARMTVTEGGLVGLAATTLGAIGGMLILLAFTWASPITTGLPLAFKPDIAPLLTAGLIATGLTIAGSALPAWRVSRVDPVTVLRYE